MIKRWGKRIIAAITMSAVLLTCSSMTAVSTNAETKNIDSESLSSYGFFNWMSTNKDATADEREDAKIATQILKGTIEDQYKKKVYNDGSILGNSISISHEDLLTYTHLGEKDDATSLENLQDAVKFIKSGNEYRAKENLSPLNVSSGLMAVSELNANLIDAKSYWGHTNLFMTLENIAGRYLKGTWQYGTFSGASDNPYEDWYDKEKANLINGSGETGHYKTLTDRQGTMSVTGFGVNYKYVESKTTASDGKEYDVTQQWKYYSQTFGDDDNDKLYNVGVGTTPDKYLAYIAQYTCSVQGHTWGEATVMNAATCTEAGSEKRTCKVCGETKTNTIAALGHKWNKGSITKAPTCVATGVKTFTCATCNGTKTETLPIDASNHVHTSKTGVEAATCTTDGYTGDVICNDCNKIITAGQVLKATGHLHKTTTGAKEATCTENGFTGKITCDDCNAVIDAGSVIAALGHDWDKGAITKAPTCVATGVKTFTCQRCDSTKTETVVKDSNNHVGGQTITGKTDATCEENGYTGDAYCNSCNALLKVGSVVTAKGHVWGIGEVTKEATCTEKGVKEYICATCNSTKTEALPIDASNHVHTSKTGAKEATCTEDGFTGKITCDDCKAVIDAGSVISATGHSWNNGTVTKPATTSEEGIKTYTCTKCKATKTEAIAKLKITVKPAPATSIAIVNTSEEQASANILAMNGDGDLKDSTYSLIQLKNATNKNTSIKLKWNKVKGAKTYIVYGNKCGSKAKKLKTTTSTAYTNSNLKKGTYYKYMVVAINSNNKVIGSSKMIHVGTTGGKICNVKKITSVNAGKNKTLKKGKSFKWKTKVVKTSSKLKLKTHRKVKFETTNKKVATVSASGKIKAVKKGTCYIYAYSQNGVSAKIKIKVK